MRQKYSLFIYLLVLAALLLIIRHAATLRRNSYVQIPESSIVLDERTWVWQGLSIRQSGIPAGWSSIETYQKGPLGDIEGFTVRVDNVMPRLATYGSYPKPVSSLKTVDFGRGAFYMSYVQPLLDNPPLGGLIYSLFIPSKVKSYLEVAPNDYRNGSLWLAVLTTVLIFVLAWQIFKSWIIALLAAAIYGSAPVFLLLSRYALLENILAPLILLVLNLLMLAESLRKSHKRLVVFLILISAVMAGSCALVKETGWAAVGMGVFLLWFWKFSYKQIITFAGVAFLVGILYFVWGMYLAPKLFPQILLYHSTYRPFIGSLNFITSIWKINILNFPLDGWWLGGFLSLLLLPHDRKYVVIFTGVITYLVATLFMGSANYPWYFIPLIPFMCLSMALFFWELAVSPKLSSILIFFLIFFSSSFYWGFGVFKAALASTHFQQPVALYRLLLLFFVVLGLGWKFWPNKMERYKPVWYLFMVGLGWWVLTLNDRSMLFMLSHWGHIPSLYTPGTF
jgi:hypothetical protein